MRKRHLLVIAPIVVSLAIAGTAYAATSHHDGVGGRMGSHFGWSFSNSDNPLGSVVSLSGTTLTVLEFNGTTLTYTVSDNTKFFLNGKSTTSLAVTAGLNVVVAGPRMWGTTTGSTTAAAIFLVSPNVLGNIQSVTIGTSGDTIVVLNPQGFEFTVQTGSATNYWVDGSSSTTAPTLTTGEIIAALGVVDTTNKDQLDATQVNVVPAHTGHHHAGW
jgi:hypothetical protein